jgi:hypothetical protein
MIARGRYDYGYGHAQERRAKPPSEPENGLARGVAFDTLERFLRYLSLPGGGGPTV